MQYGGALGDELTSCSMGVLLLRAVGVVVLGDSVVSGASPNVTLFQREEMT